MNGTLALIGGGEFRDLADLDRELLNRSGTDQVLVLPTAGAFEHPERAVARATEWFAGLDANVVPCPVLARPDASDPDFVAAVRASRFTYLVGDSPMHLRSVVKHTPLWDTLVAAHQDGGVLAASGGAAMALCDPMTDPRGGAFTLGLGFVAPLAVIPAAETWSADRVHRTRKLAHGFPLAELDTGGALVPRTGGVGAFRPGPPAPRRRRGRPGRPPPPLTSTPGHAEGPGGCRGLQGAGPLGEGPHGSGGFCELSSARAHRR